MTVIVTLQCFVIHVSVHIKSEVVFSSVTAGALTQKYWKATHDIKLQTVWYVVTEFTTMRLRALLCSFVCRCSAPGLCFNSGSALAEPDWRHISVRKQNGKIDCLSDRQGYLSQSAGLRCNYKHVLQSCLSPKNIHKQRRLRHRPNQNQFQSNKRIKKVRSLSDF